MQQQPLSQSDHIEDKIMKITRAQIYNLNPCQNGVERLNKQLRGFPQDKYFDVEDLVGGENTNADILWLLREMGYMKEVDAYDNHYMMLARASYSLAWHSTADGKAKLVAKLKEIVAAI